MGTIVRPWVGGELSRVRLKDSANFLVFRRLAIDFPRHSNNRFKQVFKPVFSGFLSRQRPIFGNAADPSLNAGVGAAPATTSVVSDVLAACVSSSLILTTRHLFGWRTSFGKECVSRTVSCAGS